jgi:hypothetical protein
MVIGDALMVFPLMVASVTERLGINFNRALLRRSNQEQK